MITLLQSDLRKLLRARYPGATIVLLDTDYNVSTDAAFEQFKGELWNLLLVAYGDKWETFFDCDNFTLEAMALAYRKHYLARKAGKGSAQSLAFGMVCYTEGSHAMAWRVKPDLSITEFEPQNRSELQLTPSQCASAWLVFAS